MALSAALFLLLPLGASFAGAAVPGSGTFVDDDGNFHEANIELIAAAGITVGCDAVNHLYCPNDLVSRAQMATFLVRAMGETPSSSYHGYFSDVANGEWYTGYVERAFELGLTTGYPDGTYRPDAPVTRAEVAAFILRALGEDSNLPAFQGYFADVLAGDWYAGYAERLYDLEITTGCDTNSLRYCGDDFLRRDEMASFLARAFLLTPTTTTTAGSPPPPPPPTNHAPVAVADSYSTDEDTQLVRAVPGVLGNDTDADADSLTAVLDTDVANGVLVLNADGSFTYTPDADWNGPDSFTYHANDGAADSNVVTVTLTVNPVNDAPVAVGDVESTPQDTPLVVPAPGVLSNDTDVDSDPLTAVLDTDVANGVLGLNANGSFTYTPDIGWNGTDSFTYHANDGTADSIVATVTIGVLDATSFASDDFFGAALNPVWTLVDPVGEATPADSSDDAMADISGSGNQLVITLPAGTAHNAWTVTNTSARVMQPAADDDFEIEAKFQSFVLQPQQDQGILIEQDADTFLRFDVYAAPGATYASPGEAHVFAAFVDGSSSTIVLNQSVVDPDEQPTWLRVTRVGNLWTFAASTDGTSFATLGTLTQPMTVTNVGVYGANPAVPGIRAPGQRVVVDYFFNTAAPIDPEDGGGTIFDIWYGDNQSFGQLGDAQRWVDILGNVDDPDGVASLSYTLNGGSVHALSMGPDSRRLLMPGDFDVQISTADLNVGSNSLTITAVDGLGHSTVKNVTINWTSGTTWSLPYSIDWNTAGSIQTVAQVVDGKWEIVGGKLHPVEIGYDRDVVIGDVSWSDYTVEVPMTILGLDTVNGYDSPSSGPGLGILMGWDGHEDCTTFSYTTCPWTPGSQPAYGWWPMGSLGQFRWSPTFEGKRITDNKAHTVDSIPQSVTIGATYMVKMQVESRVGGPLYSLKIWESGATEPSSWDLTYQADGTDPEVPSSGSFLILVHHVDVLIGNVTATPVPAP